MKIPSENENKGEDVKYRHVPVDNKLTSALFAVRQKQALSIPSCNWYLMQRKPSLLRTFMQSTNYCFLPCTQKFKSKLSSLCRTTWDLQSSLLTDFVIEALYL